jgi:OOP family OmpA-OmpF porin
MSDSSYTRAIREEPAPATPESADADLEDLRHLLLAPERHKLGELEERLDKSVVDAKSVGHVLPDAIRQRPKPDQQLARSLTPIFVDTFKRAVKGSPQLIVDAIYPILGPAIRKTIMAYLQSALQSMEQSLNRALEHSLSWQGLQWLIEAWRTGKSFGEVVLLHTLQFRVEEVFLIHRENGILLRHLYHPKVQASAGGDEDHIASMFTAITTAVQKFVGDSFRASKEDTWKSFETHGGLLVWVEPGPKAVLAGVIRGIPHAQLRSVFQDVLDTIHVEMNDALHNFRGDSSEFEAVDDHLTRCLQEEGKVQTPEVSLSRLPKVPPAAWLALAVLSTLLILIWAFFAYRDHLRWQHFHELVRHEPGLFITSVQTENSKFVVHGFRDPLSIQPDSLAEQVGLNLDSLVFELKPYLALTPDIIKKRATSVLHPPESVTISVDEENGKIILLATGFASQAWITRFRQIAEVIPGVDEVKASDLEDRSLAIFEKLRKEIEAHHFAFEQGSAALGPETKEEIATLSTVIGEIDRLAQELGRHIRIEIRGHTSKEGSLETNRRLGLARAQTVFAALNTKDLQVVQILPLGAGSGRPRGPEDGVDTLPTNRRVSLHVIIQSQKQAM